MDELDALGGLFGGVSGFGGLGGSSGGPEALSATSGGAINANTNINFGSGSISDTPVITQANPSAITTPSPAAIPVASNAALQPVQQYVTPAQNAIAGTGSIFANNKTPLYIGLVVVAVIAIYIITK